MLAQKAQTAPPKIRRITDVLYHYWEDIRGDKPFPSIDDIDVEKISDIWDDCFIVEIKDTHYHFTYFGESLQRAFASDLVDVPRKYMVSSNAEQLVNQYNKVIVTQRPLMDDNMYEDRDHIQVFYRQILLPIASDDTSDKVSFILGGMRYKLRPKTLIL